MGAAQRDGGAGSEEPGSGFAREEPTPSIAGRDHADPAAVPDPGAPVAADVGAGGPEQTAGSPGAAPPPPEPASWSRPGAPLAPAQLGPEAASTVGVGAGSSASPGVYAPPAGAVAQAGYGPAQAPHPSTAPYPAPSIGRQPSRRSSWAAPDPTRTHRWGLGAFLLAWLVFMLASAAVFFMIRGTETTAGTLVIALGVPTVLAAATALLLTRVRGNGPRTDLGLVWSWRDLGLGLAFGFGGLALTIPASIIYVAVVGEEATSAVGDEFSGIRAGPALATLVLVVVVFVAPTCEEILYRGLLWGGIEKIAGRWVALPVSTLIFAIAHLELTRTPLLIVVAIPIALARLYTGRLLASIVAHQVNNLLPGIALLLGLLGVIPMG